MILKGTKATAYIWPAGSVKLGRMMSHVRAGPLKGQFWFKKLVAFLLQIVLAGICEMRRLA
jgi:hypothetical protein